MGNLFTIAFLFAILITPSARVTVTYMMIIKVSQCIKFYAFLKKKALKLTTIGNPSGIAATAKLLFILLLKNYSIFNSYVNIIKLQIVT